jgi:hypothetical protein
MTHEHCFVAGSDFISSLKKGGPVRRGAGSFCWSHNFEDCVHNFTRCSFILLLPHLEGFSHQV